MIEDEESSIPVLSRDNSSHLPAIDTSKDSGKTKPFQPVPVYRSHGWRSAQDWEPNERAEHTELTPEDGTGKTGIKNSDAPHWRRDENFRRNRKDSNLSGSRDCIQNFAQSCDQKRRKFIMSTKSEVKVRAKSVSSIYQEELSCPHVGDEEISIGLEIQAILRGLKIGNELQHYRLVSASLRPLAEALGTTVLVTGSSSPDYDNSSILERTSVFEVNDAKNILTEMSQDRAVEISTPMLKKYQWESVVPEIYELLTSEFQLEFNGSTGLHLQVGIGREYSLQDLKRIAKAIVLFEKQMNTCHPKSRNPVSPTKWPYTYAQILPCRGSMPLNGLADLEKMRKIDEARFIPELIRIINYDYLVYAGELHRHYRYNFREVLRTDTIEFRQAIGNTQTNKTLEWISRTTKFMTTAVATSDTEFQGWAEQGIRDPGIYHLFGVPPPHETGFRLRIQMCVPRKKFQAAAGSISAIIGLARRRNIYVFKRVRAGRIGRGLFWYIYYWSKGDNRSNSLNRARVLLPTIILVMRAGK